MPSNAWYCSRCSERQAKISKSDTSNAFDNIDSFRDKEEEDGLIDLCANEKVNGKDPFTANQDEVSITFPRSLYFLTSIINRFSVFIVE